jgi:hypothetical protein
MQQTMQTLLNQQQQQQQHIDTTQHRSHQQQMSLPPPLLQYQLTQVLVLRGGVVRYQLAAHGVAAAVAATEPTARSCLSDSNSVIKRQLLVNSSQQPGGGQRQHCQLLEGCLDRLTRHQSAAGYAGGGSPPICSLVFDLTVPAADLCRQLQSDAQDVATLAAACPQLPHCGCCCSTTASRPAFIPEAPPGSSCRAAAAGPMQ